MEKEKLLQIIKEEGNEMDFEWLGMPCLIKRAGENSHWCGYVKVPNDSRLYKKHYYTSSESELGISKLEEAINNIDIHGGLTYAGERKEDGNWWFGFDCGHSGDLSLYMLDGHFFRDYNSRYRDKDYVIGECKYLAKQLKQIIELKL